MCVAKINISGKSDVIYKRVLVKTCFYSICYRYEIYFLSATLTCFYVEYYRNHHFPGKRGKIYVFRRIRRKNYKCFFVLLKKKQKTKKKTFSKLTWHNIIKIIIYYSLEVYYACFCKKTRNNRLKYTENYNRAYTIYILYVTEHVDMWLTWLSSCCNHCIHTLWIKILIVMFCSVILMFCLFQNLINLVKVILEYIRITQ